MAVFKCKMCGGTIEFEEGATVGVCDSCGTKQTLPKTTDETVANLFNRANNLRLKSEFDKAEQIYEKIVQLDDSEAEAHWGIVLCKYGIEYVEDPKTFTRIPTCHRACYDAVTSDPDYQAAIDYSDAGQQAIYESEARAIERIQKDILAIVAKEEPFDVFICYKETDENGKRTVDSAIANDIYYQLTQEGFKVFYAAITLEDKLGQEYEPYIFAALHSAKVMLVIGTKPEYYNAVWVKNEWSRYLKLMKEDRSKLLIPCYRDMDAYDLPEEFAHLQAQDMSKIGFINDVVRGIKKVISVDVPVVVNETVVVNNASSSNTASFLERAFIFLEDEKWADADLYCEKVLDIEPKNAEAYLGKLMAELKVKNRKRLADCTEPFDSRENYKKIICFASEKLEAEMREYIFQINGRIESEKREYEDKINAFAQVIKNHKSSESMISRREKLQSEIASMEKWIIECPAKTERASIVKSEIETLKAQRDSLIADKAALGLFKKKEKVAIDGQIREIDKKSADLKRELDDLESMINQYKFVSDIVSEKERKQKELNRIEDNLAPLLDTTYTYEDVNRELKDNKAFRADVLTMHPEIGLQICEVGDCIEFGKYPNSSSEDLQPIEWIVLRKSDGLALIISKNIIDKQKYNSTQTDVIWGTCSLRTWLNTIFLSNAFSSNEQARIKPSSRAAASINPNKIILFSPSEIVIDKIFVLTGGELKDYFLSDNLRRCKSTTYAGENDCWWTRTIGEDKTRAALVLSSSGEIGYFGRKVDSVIGVRPALWLKVDS